MSKSQSIQTAHKYLVISCLTISYYFTKNTFLFLKKMGFSYLLFKYEGCFQPSYCVTYHAIAFIRRKLNTERFGQLFFEMRYLYQM